nr:MAG TPA: hypothetical protein [Caudoviricetes sp.]
MTLKNRAKYKKAQNEFYKSALWAQTVFFKNSGKNKKGDAYLCIITIDK